MAESKSLSIETNNEKSTLQDSSIFSCPKCSHSSKWRNALVRHMKVHEREGISLPMSPSLTVQHVPTSSKSPHLILSPPGGLRRSGRFSVKPAVSSPSESIMKKKDSLAFWMLIFLVVSCRFTWKISTTVSICDQLYS